MGWMSIPMLSRTHGQPASPTTLGKEMMVFLERITPHLVYESVLVFEILIVKHIPENISLSPLSPEMAERLEKQKSGLRKTIKYRYSWRGFYILIILIPIHTPPVFIVILLF